MLNLLAAVDIGTIIMLCVIVLLAVALFFFNRAARKKNKQLEEERMSSFKVGDKVMTSSGIYGTIVDIKEISPVDKLVNIRTGTEEESSVLPFDIRPIYRPSVSNNGETEEENGGAAENTAASETPAENSEVTSENTAENNTESAVDETASSQDTEKASNKK